MLLSKASNRQCSILTMTDKGAKATVCVSKSYFPEVASLQSTSDDRRITFGSTRHAPHSLSFIVQQILHVEEQRRIRDQQFHVLQLFTVEAGSVGSSEHQQIPVSCFAGVIPEEVGKYASKFRGHLALEGRVVRRQPENPVAFVQNHRRLPRATSDHHVVNAHRRAVLCHERHRVRRPVTTRRGGVDVVAAVNTELTGGGAGAACASRRPAVRRREGDRPRGIKDAAVVVVERTKEREAPVAEDPCGVAAGVWYQNRVCGGSPIETGTRKSRKENSPPSLVTIGNSIGEAVRRLSLTCFRDSKFL